MTGDPGMSAWHAPPLIAVHPGSTLVLLGVAAQVEGCLHERDMAERLRHIAHEPAVPGIILLTQQAHVVTQGEQPLEQRNRLVPVPAQLQCVGQPETAGQERALRSGQAINRRRSAVGQLVPAQYVAACAMPRGVRLTGVRSQMESGPAVALRPTPSLVTQGTTEPYPKRSVRGRQSQFAEPSVQIKAAVCMSPTMA
jgi:hypothetical protein